MASSQNGYTANDRNLTQVYQAPGGTLRLRRGPTGELLAYVASRFHNEVEALVWPGCWAYAERTIRGSSTTLSNHASGTAIDLNAPRHPLGKSNTFSGSQVQAIRRILTDLDGCVRWGGNYTSRKDEMHFEIVASEAKCAGVLARLRLTPGTPAPQAPAQPAPQAPVPVHKATRRPDSLPVLRRGSKGGWVALLQKVLGIKVDQDFGPATERALRAAQGRLSLGQDAVAGPATWAGLVILGGQLRQGDKGPRVELLQNFCGFRPGAGLDSDFGSATAEVVRQIQRWGGVGDDAIVGDDTRKVLARA